MNKLKAYFVLISFVFCIFCGFAYPRGGWAAGQNGVAGGTGAGAEAGESLERLKAKLWDSMDVQERRNIVDVFNGMPGPDAAAAQVLLDYLKKNPGMSIDPGNFIEALVKLMTDEQVAQLAKDIHIYVDACNGAGSYPLLVFVLTARINNSIDLTSALLSLQKGCFDDKYSYESYLCLQLMQQAWPRVFSDPEEAAKWLDQIYTELSNPGARRSLVHAAGVLAGTQPSGADRAAVTGWLWRAQEKETDAAYRCGQLFTLYQLGETKALEILDSLYAGIASARDRAGLISIIAGSDLLRQKEAGKNDLAGWLWKTAETDVSPFCRQECLAVLYTGSGQEKALEQFVRETEQDGMASLQEEQASPMNRISWQLLRDAGQKYPQSFLGRGIKAYEAVRGRPYFEIDRPKESFEVIWVPPYGDEEYDPEREIPAWEGFLTEFSRHPAADDAAYRLARCYEIEERFTDAVNTMRQARFSPDGDMRYASDGRLVYILDVRMSYDQLKALSLEKLTPPLDGFVSYSLAVKEIRRDDFQRAAARLEEFLEMGEGPASGRYTLPFDYPGNSEQYDFRKFVEKQLAEVKGLAGLQTQWEKSKEPADLYNLAASIYHNQMLCYNHLWAGQRQDYNWLGYINATGHGHAPAEMTAFVREMINYNHSLPYFRQVYQNPSSPPELKARALYSTGLCCIGLDEWGDDASFGFSLPEIREKIISTYQQFVREYPGSSMADDALLALGAYTGDAAYLQRVLEEYPGGDTIEKAKSLLKELEHPYYRPPDAYGYPAPYKTVFLEDKAVPQEIRDWAAANILHPFAGAKTLGQWSYLLVAAGEKPTAGCSVGVIRVSGSSDGLKVYFRLDDPPSGQAQAQVLTRPYALIRIPATVVPVEFVEGNPW